MSLADQIYEAGVVGAGGGGFPSHIKAGSKAEIILANGAECEPLLHKDYEIMVNFAPQILRGMDLMMESVGANKGYFGIKSKNAPAVETVKNNLKNSKITITELGDFYPSGDEYELVYEATKRLIPPAGIPLDVGCVVNNVETFYNVALASENIPVTKKFLCVTGAVKNPKSFFAPIGISFKELIDFCGGATVKDYAIYVSGVMMGRLTFDVNEPVTKTNAGIIILPKDHQIIRRKSQPPENWHRIGKSACDQCSYCTELCPRYLLGYNVQPHKVMRSLVFTKTGESVWNQMAELCCACGLCTLYACPEDLFPKEACDKAKVEMRSEGIKYKQTEHYGVHPMKEGRRVPLKQLIKRLNLQEYDVKTPFTSEEPSTTMAVINLKQHAGEKARPKISLNETVKKGQLIAEPPEGKLGAKIHSSIDGIATEITDDYIRIKG